MRLISPLRPGPSDDLLDVFQQVIALFAAQRLVDAARHRAGAMDALARGNANDLLPVLAQQHALPGDVRMVLDHADDIALADRSSKPNSRSGEAQMEEMQRVRLQGLAEMHQAAHLFGRRRQLRRADQHVGGLGRRQVMADRADAAQALYQNRQFPVGPPLDEFLEAAEFDDVQSRLLDMVLVIEQQRDFAMPLNAGDRLDHDALQSSGLVAVSSGS